MSRKVIAILIAIGAVVVLAAGWYFASPLFINRQVDEAFPAQLPTIEEAQNMPAEELEETLVTVMEAADGMSEDEMAGMAEEVQELAALMPDKAMDEGMPEGTTEPVLITEGDFVDADSFHQGSGAAKIYQLPDGSNVLRFEEFEVTNGPDLHVILSTSANPTNRTDIGEDHIDLGELKGNLGNQNYEIPGSVELSEIQSVVIYCQPFHVVFSTATLSG